MNGFGIHRVTAKSDTNEHKIAYYQEINSTTQQQPVQMSFHQHYYTHLINYE